MLVSILSFLPGSLAAAKEIEQQPETPASVKRNISELQRRHRDEMQKLYTMQAEDYLEGARTRYFSKDDSIADPQIDVRLLPFSTLYLMR